MTDRITRGKRLPHAVHDWEHQAADQVLFCTVTALGLVRLVCQPKLMGTAVKNAAEASALLAALGQQPGVKLAEPEHGGWTAGRGFRPAPGGPLASSGRLSHRAL